MGFLITSEFTEYKEVGTNFYVGITGLPLTKSKNMDGETTYYMDVTYFIKKERSRDHPIGPNRSFRVNFTTQQVKDSNIAALGNIVFTALKALPIFAGCTFEDVLDD
jgi:hypothetical protein